MTRIVFSKNRALQLHAFLRSYADHVTPMELVKVLYLASSDRHQRAYDEVFRAFSWVEPYTQSDFRLGLLRMMPTIGTVVLFADDHLFLRPWLADETEVGVNLHLGLNLTHCYTVNKAQPIPPHRLGVEKVTWRWGIGQLDWGYPLCPCGQVFDAAEFHKMLSCIQFYSPNTLEQQLQVFTPAFWDRYGICYQQSKLVLLPWNRVQSECPNRIATDLPSADGLLDQWEAGQQIEVRPLYGILNESVHQELPLVLETR